MIEGFLLKFLTGISTKIITKYADRFEAIFEAEAKARIKKMGVTEEQVSLLAELNKSKTKEERFAIIRKIQNYSTTLPS